MGPAPVIPSDLARLTDVTEVRTSPDGALTAAAVSRPDVEENRYLRDVLILATDGSSDPITVQGTVDGRTRMPRWSPTGDRLAVVVDDPKGSAVVLLDLAGGPDRRVVSDWPDPIEELSWSPDGRHLLFVVREPTDRAFWEVPESRRPPLRLTALGYREDGIGWTVGRPRQAYLVTLADETNAPATFSIGGFDDAEFSWHPDGQSVFFLSRRHDGMDRSPANAVYRQALSGEPERITEPAMAFAGPLSSPTGEHLAVALIDVVRYPAATHLGLIDPLTGAITDLTTELDRDCHPESFTWLSDTEIATVVDHGGASGVFVFDVTTPGRYRELAGGERRATSFALAGGRLVLVGSDPTHPPAVWVRDSLHAGADSSGERRLVDPNAGFTGAHAIGGPTHTAVTVADGVEVDSWLVLPDVARWPAPHPTILWLQGGGSQYGYQWSHELQMLHSAGYAVLYLNPRGSAGYGTEWMRSVAGARAAQPGSGWGGDDIADVVAVLRDTLTRHPELDSARVGVMGGSYGGLVTTHLLAQTDLFAAGWAERGPYNLYSDAGTKDEAPWFFEAYLGGNHLDDPESYWQASPLRLVRGITAPLAIVHSEEDRRCSIGQAEELFMALKLLEREVEFIRFPGECHGLTRSGSPVHRLQRLEILLEWFGRRLGPTG